MGCFLASFFFFDITEIHCKSSRLTLKVELLDDKDINHISICPQL